MPSPADREKALESALAQIDRQFGKGSVMRLGSDERAPVEVIPTGSIALDVALGIGGLPRGRIVEIYGPESSGKTTLTLHAIANVQKQGGIAAFIDAEHALDPEYARKLGVDIDELLVSQPDTGEQALEIADMLIRSGSIDLIVIDSVAALVPKAEIEGEMGDSHVGLQARLMSQALRKLTGGLNTTNTTMIFINQLREKIGVFFGSPETTAGGKALKFYASVRLDIRRIETLKDGTDAVGNRTRVKVVKNKMAPPFKQAEFDILYGTGISREGSLIDFGVEHGIVKKSGSWYTYDGEQLGQGKENARTLPAQERGCRGRHRVEDQGEARHRPAQGRGRGCAGCGRTGGSPPGLMVRLHGDGGERTNELAPVIPLFGGAVRGAGRRARTETRLAVRVAVSEEYWADDEPVPDEPAPDAVDAGRTSPSTAMRCASVRRRRCVRSLGAPRLSVVRGEDRGCARTGSTDDESAAIIDDFIGTASSTTRRSPSSSCTSASTARVRAAGDRADARQARHAARRRRRGARRCPTTRPSARSSSRAPRRARSATRRRHRPAAADGQLARRGYGGSVAATAARTALATSGAAPDGSGVRFR